MKKILSLLAAVSLVVSAAYFCPVFDGLRPVVGLENKYERAAHSAVLIKTTHGQGTGVTVIRRTAAGNPVVFVWTAAHVVHGVNDVLVVQPIRSQWDKVGDVTINAHVVVRDEARDVALLQVEGNPTEYFHGAKFAGSEPPQRGTKLFHCGNFFGNIFDGSLSTGVVSQIGVQSAPDCPWMVIDQTDLLIIPGSSGGPIFLDSNSRVVGLAVGIFGGRVNVYVPVRALRAVASWAVDEDNCPGLATLAEMRTKAHVEPPAPIIELFFGR